jgi:hypothetical protein
MTPTIHGYAVMAPTGHIGSVLAERPLLALSLAQLWHSFSAARVPRRRRPTTPRRRPSSPRATRRPRPPPRPRPFPHLSTLSRRRDSPRSSAGRKERLRRHRRAFESPSTLYRAACVTSEPGSVVGDPHVLAELASATGCPDWPAFGFYLSGMPRPAPYGK